MQTTLKTEGIVLYGVLQKQRCGKWTRVLKAADSLMFILLVGGCKTIVSYPLKYEQAQKFRVNTIPHGWSTWIPFPAMILTERNRAERSGFNNHRCTLCT